MERIALAREYRVADWLRDAYFELTQKTPLNFEELRPAEPYYSPLDRSPEADTKKWEETFKDWETLARISLLQTKVVTKILSFSREDCHYCTDCKISYGVPYRSLCKCRILAMVDEAFGEELKSLRENSEQVQDIDSLFQSLQKQK